MVGENDSYIDTCKKHLDETDKELDQIDEVMATNTEQVKCARLQSLVEKTWGWKYDPYHASHFVSEP